MKLDKYVDWKPIETLPNDLYVWNIESESTSITVLLKQIGVDNMVLKIKFNGVLCYRVTQESGRSKSINENDSFSGFKMTLDSELIRWFKDESYGMFDEWIIKHYLICNIDSVLDVITNQEPSVVIISNN